MKWSEVQPGRYQARIKDWGLEEVEKLGGLIKAVIQFDVNVPTVDSDSEYVSGRWEGFLETKEGRPNMKTMKTLVTCGLKSDDVMDLAISGSALDNTKDYEVTVTAETVNGKTYNRIEWVNLPGLGGGINKAKPTKKLPAKFKAALADARKALNVPAPKTVKNYAPGASEPDTTDELGF
jgi:hypothetical protein